MGYFTKKRLLRNFSSSSIATTSTDAASFSPALSEASSYVGDEINEPAGATESPRSTRSISPGLEARGNGDALLKRAWSYVDNFTDNVDVLALGPAYTLDSLDSDLFSQIISNPANDIAAILIAIASGAGVTVAKLYNDLPESHKKLVNKVGNREKLIKKMGEIFNRDDSVFKNDYAFNEKQKTFANLLTRIQTHKTNEHEPPTASNKLKSLLTTLANTTKWFWNKLMEYSLWHWILFMGTCLLMGIPLVASLASMPITTAILLAIPVAIVGSLTLAKKLTSLWIKYRHKENSSKKLKAERQQQEKIIKKLMIRAAIEIYREDTQQKIDGIAAQPITTYEKDPILNELAKLLNKSDLNLNDLEKLYKNYPQLARSEAKIIKSFFHNKWVRAATQALIHAGTGFIAVTTVYLPLNEGLQLIPGYIGIPQAVVTATMFGAATVAALGHAIYGGVKAYKDFTKYDAKNKTPEHIRLILLQHINERSRENIEAQLDKLPKTKLSSNLKACYKNIPKADDLYKKDPSPSKKQRTFTMLKSLAGHILAAARGASNGAFIARILALSAIPATIATVSIAAPWILGLFGISLAIPPLATFAIPMVAACAVTAAGAAIFGSLRILQQQHKKWQRQNGEMLEYARELELALDAEKKLLESLAMKVTSVQSLAISVKNKKPTAKANDKKPSLFNFWHKNHQDNQNQKTVTDDMLYLNLSRSL